MKWNHDFEFNFVVPSDKDDASDVTPEMLLAACVKALGNEPEFNCFGSFEVNEVTY